jgi:SAM-dependent methyltransferase
MSTERSVHPDASNYDRRVGAFSRAFAQRVVAAVRWTSDVRRVLDHGAGTGLTTRLVHGAAPDATIVALDPSAAFLSALPAEPWCTAEVGTAASIDHRAAFDIVVSNLTLMFCEDAPTTLASLRAATVPGGCLSLSVLGPPGTVQPFDRYWEAVRRVLPRAWPPHRYPHHRFAELEQLADLARAAGWEQVGIDAVDTVTVSEPSHAWEWVRHALPVGLDDGYSPLPAEAEPDVREVFLDGCPSEHHASGWLLHAVAPVEASG